MSEWICTKDKFPPDRKTVLLLFQDQYGEKLITGYWDDQNGEFIQEARSFLGHGEFDELYHKKKSVPFWMPLPEAPYEQMD